MRLDALYGHMRPPMYLRAWEDRAPVSLSILDRNLAQALSNLKSVCEHSLLKMVAQSTNYLWAMDVGGNVWIAVEELAFRSIESDTSGLPMLRRILHPSDTKKLGHPTLVNRGEARIAGELAMDAGDGGLRWILNAQSGRYCRENPPSQAQIDNVGKLFQSFGLSVDVEYE